MLLPMNRRGEPHRFCQDLTTRLHELVVGTEIRRTLML